jgi:microcompartment protein CcmL/EutN
MTKASRAAPPAAEAFEALAVVETASIARGLVVVDAALKRAPVRLLQSRVVSPGKHLLVLAGGVAEVEESLAAALAVAKESLVDKLFIPQLHAQLPALLAGGAGAAPADSVLVFETATVCAAILGADAALKAARVDLVDLRLAAGIGGKAFFTLTGPLEDIEAAALAAQLAVGPAAIVAVETIAAPHEDLARTLFV